MKPLVVAFAVALGSTCNTPPPGPVPPDAADAALIYDGGSAECAAACAALSTAGCAMGRDVGCAAWLTSELGTGKHANPATGGALTCSQVATVKTMDDARREGFACQP